MSKFGHLQKVVDNWKFQVVELLERDRESRANNNFEEVCLDVNPVMHEDGRAVYGLPWRLPSSEVFPGDMDFGCKLDEDSKEEVTKEEEDIDVIVTVMSKEVQESDENIEFSSYNYWREEIHSIELFPMYLNPEDKTRKMNKEEVTDEEEEIDLSIDIEKKTNFEIVSSSDCDDLTESEKVKSIETCEVKEGHSEEDKISTYDLKEEDEIKEYEREIINANNVRRDAGDMEQRQMETGDIESMGIQRRGEGALLSAEDLTNLDYVTDPYGHVGLHEIMLKDESRTLAYRDAILSNKHLFQDKVVLDVGCGTGIFSMFAAQAGAARVIGVDVSAIAEIAKLIVMENNLSEVVTIIRGRVEEVELPEDITQVDVIISEWMGSCLFHNCMLNTVIYARDKWLASSGVMFPDLCALYICGVENFDFKEKLNYWDNVYGYKMSSIKRSILREPVITTDVNREAVVTTSWLIKEVDLLTCRKEELTFCSPFHLEVIRKNYVQALMTYFEVSFTQCRQTIKLSTSPFAAPTYWKQTLFYLEDYMTAQEGEEICGTFKMWSNNRTNRDLGFEVCVQHEGELKYFKEKKKYDMK